jgi:hypothetical protein
MGEEEGFPVLYYNDYPNSPLAESDLVIIKNSIERSTLQKVREFFRRQQFGIY